MKNFLRLSMFFVFTLILSCNSVKLTRRYKKAAYEDLGKVDSCEYVDVEFYTFSNEKPEEHKSVFDLSDGGQEAYINAISEKKDSTEKFIEALSTFFWQEQSDYKVLFKNRFKQRLVFSVKDLTQNEANRISSIEIELSLISDSVKFITWDRISTEYQTIDMGKVTFDRTKKAGVTIGAGSGSSSVIPFLGKKNEVKEEMPLVKKYVGLSGILKDATATLYQEGVPGADLTGNIIADIELQVNNLENKLIYSVGYPFGTDGVPLDLDEIDFHEERHFFPALKNDILAKMVYKFTFRKVLDGERTIPEYDDKVSFISGKVERDKLVLVSQDQMEVPTWGIGTDTTCTNDSLLFFINSSHQTRIRKMEFISYEKAYEFYKWLKLKDNSNFEGEYHKIQFGSDTSNVLNKNTVNKLKTCRILNKKGNGNSESGTNPGGH